MPAAEDALERAVPHRFAQHDVHGVAQRRVGPGEHADVAAHRHRLGLDHEAAPRCAGEGPLGDDVIEQHRVHAARHEVAVGVDVVVVRHGDESARVAGGEQDVVGHGRAEGGDAPAAQIGEPAEAAPISGADGEHFAKLEVRNGDGVLRAAGRRVFHPRHPNLEVTALDRLVDG